MWNLENLHFLCEGITSCLIMQRSWQHGPVAHLMVIHLIPSNHDIYELCITVPWPVSMDLRWPIYTSCKLFLADSCISTIPPWHIVGEPYNLLFFCHVRGESPALMYHQNFAELLSGYKDCTVVFVDGSHVEGFTNCAFVTEIKFSLTVCTVSVACTWQKVYAIYRAVLFNSSSASTWYIFVHTVVYHYCSTLSYEMLWWRPLYSFP